jgi:hypothetical protein
MCSPHSILAVYVQSAKGMLNLRSAICSWAGTTYRPPLLSPPGRFIPGGFLLGQQQSLGRPLVSSLLQCPLPPVLNLPAWSGPHRASWFSGETKKRRSEGFRVRELNESVRPPNPLTSRQV